MRQAITILILTIYLLILVPRWVDPNLLVYDLYVLLMQTARNIYDSLGGSLQSLPNPNVPIYCLYGTNKQTELYYEYDNGLSEQPTTIHYDQGGDGVVPIQSLRKCLSMNPVSSREFNLVSHGGMYT